jgi:hypothetical protein
VSLYVPCISFKPRQINHFAYNAEIRRKAKRRYNPYTAKPPKDEKLMSIRKRNRIQNAIQVLYDISDSKKVFVRASGKRVDFRLNFITVTLPAAQRHTDREIHTNIFLPFIRRLKGILKSWSYVYRIETQKNGNLHYHIAGNCFIHYSDLAAIWDYYCGAFGYVDSSGSDHSATTQVKAMHGIKDLAAYMSKYMSKSTGADYRKVEIRDWGCSVALTKFKLPVIEFPTAEMKAECRRLWQVFKTTKKFEYCWIQPIKYHQLLRYAPVIASFYTTALEIVKSYVVAPS